MNISATVVSLTAIGALVGGVWAIDARYALAADMRSLTEVITKQMSLNQLSTEVAVLEQRRNYVIDKISEGVARDSKKPGDRAIADRYSYELKDVDAQLLEKRRLMDRVKAK